MGSGGSHSGVAPRPVQTFRRGGRASAAPEAVAPATRLRRQGGWDQVKSGGPECPLTAGQERRCGAWLLAQTAGHLPSTPHGGLLTLGGHCLSPHQLSPPRAFGPSEDLRSGRVRYPGGRAHTAPQGCSASFPSCVSLAPKTARPGLYVSGKGAAIPSCNAPIHR